MKFLYSAENINLLTSRCIWHLHIYTKSRYVIWRLNMSTLFKPCWSGFCNWQLSRFLARSANLPTGLYISLALISLLRLISSCLSPNVIKKTDSTNIIYIIWGSVWCICCSAVKCTRVHVTIHWRFTPTRLSAIYASLLQFSVQADRGRLLSFRLSIYCCSRF